jgi:hypothetical protein
MVTGNVRNVDSSAGIATVLQFYSAQVLAVVQHRMPVPAFVVSSAIT